MDKKDTNDTKVKTDSAIGAKAKVGATSGQDNSGIVWVREDGAICVGDGCIVIKPESGTKNLDVEIAPTKCGEATADLFMEHLIKTVGKGGNTRFTVKSEFAEE